MGDRTMNEKRLWERLRFFRRMQAAFHRAAKHSHFADFALRMLDCRNVYTMEMRRCIKAIRTQRQESREKFMGENI